jgi:hypothetical protein
LVSILQISEELRLYNRVLNLTISNLGLKAVSSNGFLAELFVVFLGVMIGGYSERGCQDPSNVINVAS